MTIKENLFSKLCRIELNFKSCHYIGNLPFYHGPQWNACIRNSLKNYLTGDDAMADAGIFIHPIETGIHCYEVDESINLGLTFPEESKNIVVNAIKNFNNSILTQGHFQAKTIKLEKIQCLFSGNITNQEFLTENDIKSFDINAMQNEIKALLSLDSFHIVFFSPLRLNRPQFTKKYGHKLVDISFFMEKEEHCLRGSRAILHLINSVKFSSDVSLLATNLEIEDGMLTFYDMKYGQKNIGGFLGSLKIKGMPDEAEALRLISGKYTGIGKKRTFGFGFYDIPEVAKFSQIRPFTRAKSLFERFSSVDFLKKSFESLPDSSPGPDGFSKKDIAKSSDSFFLSISEKIRNFESPPGNYKRYNIPKNNGGYREIFVQNISSRIIQRAASDILNPSINSFLSNSAFAYRKGFNREFAAENVKNFFSEGYIKGIKTDVENFFPSVNRKKLMCLIKSLYCFDPIIEYLETIFTVFDSLNLKGLPQGSPLSPILSNLYLDYFDKEMTNEGFKIIRYGDDFVILFNQDIHTDFFIEKIETVLKKLDLNLNKDKTFAVNHEKGIDFLGYTITSSEITITAKEKEIYETEDESWLPVFHEQWFLGHPVYITSISRGSYCNYNELIIKFEENQYEKINWNSISRVVIVGRSSFSGHVVYSALLKQIPVAFIDVLGIFRGHLFPANYELEEIADLQKVFRDDEKFRLDFAKRIISAKIHNSSVILRRNKADNAGLRECIEKLENAKKIDEVFGYEGYGAKLYFDAMREIVKPFEFEKREYHPPVGPVNVMLSFGYTLLYNRIASALLINGFNAKIGFYHTGRGSHYALASDLMEELRHIIERITISMIHKGEIKHEDFMEPNDKNKFWRFSGEGFRKFIRKFEFAMSETTTYSGGEKMSYNAYLDEIAHKLKLTLKLKIPYETFRIR